MFCIPTHLRRCRANFAGALYHFYATSTSPKQAVTQQRQKAAAITQPHNNGQRNRLFQQQQLKILRRAITMGANQTKTGYFTGMNVTIKTAEEIEKMRVAGRLAAEALEMIGEYVKPGVTTGELDRICHEYIVNEQQAIAC
ncbi:MAG: hypothetical protein AAFN68_09620, partial [Pseudomonadota bacterium]